MEVLIVIIILIAVIVALVGIIGAIVPALPGPPLNLGSLVVAWMLAPEYVSGNLVLWMLGLTILVTILDYVAPIWLTKIGGGSKKAIWGSTLGIIAGLLFMPIGLIVGPLLGAFFGEMMHEDNVQKALRVSLMSFVSFLITTGFKLVLSLVMTYYTLSAFANHVYDAILSFA